MDVRRFQTLDLITINAWYARRGLRTLHERELSQAGFIVPGVAAVFLYGTDSNFAFIENLISNPDRAPGVRKEAIDMLVDATEKEAKALGYDRILFLSEHKQVFDHGKRHGFEFVTILNLYKKEI